MSADHALTAPLPTQLPANVPGEKVENGSNLWATHLGDLVEAPGSWLRPCCSHPGTGQSLSLFATLAFKSNKIFFF